MQQTIPIGDADDPRVEPFRAIRDRDLAGRGGFIAEGTVVLDQLLVSTRFRPVSLLILRARLAHLADRLARLPPDVPVYVAERPVFDAVAGFPVHRGVMAYGEARPDDGGTLAAHLASVQARSGCVVIASGLSNHDNMGAIFRNSAAFGAGAVILDDRACDPLYRKAIRVSVGCVLTVPFWRLGSPAAIHQTLTDAGFECLALTPNGSMRLDELRGSGPRALFFGTEGEGLGETFLSGRNTLRIAMASGLDSLNVATSAAIALHHFFWLGQGQG